MKCSICETPAKIIYHDDYCELIVHNRFHEEVARSKFSKRHAPVVEKLRWAMSTGGYPRNIKLRKTLHQVIKAAKPGFEIDHINGDKLDNRDENLRYATRTENSRNLPLSKRNKSGIKGVWWDKINNAWQVKICVDRKQIFLGRFKTIEEARTVRAQAEREYYGEFARPSLW